MFNDIEQLENEIREFRKNILASNEMINVLDNAAESIKAIDANLQKYAQDLSKQSSDNLESMVTQYKDALDGYRRITEKTAQDISSDNQMLIDNAIIAFRNEQENSLKALQDITVAFKEATQAQNNYIDESIVAVNEAQNNLNTKYEGFIHKLDTISIEQILNECQETKKTINTKFAILLGGVGVAIIVSILSIIIK